MGGHPAVAVSPEPASRRPERPCSRAFCGNIVRVVGTCASRIASILTALTPATARADHGVGGARPSGNSLGWLFLAVLLIGFLLVALLAGWAMFAPEREDADEEAAPKRRPR